MSSKQDRAKEQMQRGAAVSVERAAGRLRGQWSSGSFPKCLHHSWESLAQAVGLGSDPKTIGALKQWVHNNKLPEPRRPTARG